MVSFSASAPITEVAGDPSPALREGDEVRRSSSSASWSLLRTLTWRLKHDENWHRDLSLGHRVGFYQMKGNVGRGNFSNVKMAIHSLTKERVGVKVIDKTKLDGKTTKMLLREIKVMDACNHSNLVRLYEVLENKTKLYFIMQFGEGGELFTKITSHGRLGEPRARDIFLQVCSGVHYMHQQGMIHRDIKAENVFFTSKDHVLLGDFGFAKRLEKMEQHLTTFCGSPPYAAPELFVDDHYIGPSVDLWALGILLYFMVTASMPFHATTVAALKNLILEGSFNIPSYVSPNCSALLRNILKKKPTSRASFEDISSSDWMSGIGPEGWVEGDLGYRSCPRLGSDNLSNSEVEVLEELEAIGITESVLKQDLMLGVRSPVIATYRILLHKRLKSSKAQISQNSSKSSLTNIVPSNNGDSLIESDKLKSSQQAFKNLPSENRKKKSKLCIIL